MRMQATSHYHRPTEPAHAATWTVPLRQFVICFEYAGHTGLSVVGGATGRYYRFDRPGARVMVDPRDRPSLAALGCLRQV